MKMLWFVFFKKILSKCNITKCNSYIIYFKDNLNFIFKCAARTKLIAARSNRLNTRLPISLTIIFVNAAEISIYSDVLEKIYLSILSLIIILCILLSVAYAILLERKVLASIQRRRGPNYVGFLGLLQPIADAIKLILKETIIPSAADKIIFILSPLIALTLSLVNWSIIPFFENGNFADINVSILMFFAISSLTVYGIIMSGWSSNSKYAFLGALRAAAQVIAYEVCIGLTLVYILIQTKSLNYNDIIMQQIIVSNVVVCFIFFILFFIACLAETNRPPFDLPEAEAELVSGYNVEYSAMTFGYFFLSEYVSIWTVCALNVIIFFGGHIFMGISSIFFFVLKTIGLVIVFIWVRASVPRYRYDQLMRLGWKILLPITLGCLLFFISIYYYYLGKETSKTLEFWITLVLDLYTHFFDYLYNFFNVSAATKEEVLMAFRKAHEVVDVNKMATDHIEYHPYGPNKSLGPKMSYAWIYYLLLTDFFCTVNTEYNSAVEIAEQELLQACLKLADGLITAEHVDYIIKKTKEYYLFVLLELYIENATDISKLSDAGFKKYITDHNMDFVLQDAESYAWIEKMKELKRLGGRKKAIIPIILSQITLEAKDSSEKKSSSSEDFSSDENPKVRYDALIDPKEYLDEVKEFTQADIVKDPYWEEQYLKKKPKTISYEEIKRWDANDFSEKEKNSLAGQSKKKDCPAKLLINDYIVNIFSKENEKLTEDDKKYIWIKLYMYLYDALDLNNYFFVQLKKNSFLSTHINNKFRWIEEDFYYDWFIKNIKVENVIKDKMKNILILKENFLKESILNKEEEDLLPCILILEEICLNFEKIEDDIASKLMEEKNYSNNNIIKNLHYLTNFINLSIMLSLNININNLLILSINFLKKLKLYKNIKKYLNYLLKKKLKKQKKKIWYKIEKITIDSIIYNYYQKIKYNKIDFYDIAAIRNTFYLNINAYWMLINLKNLRWNLQMRGFYDENVEINIINLLFIQLNEMKEDIIKKINILKQNKNKLSIYSWIEELVICIKKIKEKIKIIKKKNMEMSIDFLKKKNQNQIFKENIKKIKEEIKENFNKLLKKYKIVYNFIQNKLLKKIFLKKDLLNFKKKIIEEGLNTQEWELEWFYDKYDKDTRYKKYWNWNEIILALKLVLIIFKPIFRNNKFLLQIKEELWNQKNDEMDNKIQKICIKWSISSPVTRDLEKQVVKCNANNDKIKQMLDNRWKCLSIINFKQRWEFINEKLQPYYDINIYDVTLFVEPIKYIERINWKKYILNVVLNNKIKKIKQIQNDYDVIIYSRIDLIKRINKKKNENIEMTLNYENLLLIPDNELLHYKNYFLKKKDNFLNWYKSNKNWKENKRYKNWKKNKRYKKRNKR